ncbi:DUF748 domain-containing protein [Pseudoduganella aquatica]|uniref:DUF748 domain-containing protein n=1 Tax=Pseudoduganella aquatica TaxID=2660641 RepID=A0A7X4KM37_9BURK|nr:DUF748 domain-containing protein [Pseudoduganella aquatica]MYN07708.1 DUF748 domain-containing protein [Pseudoduganella aquatica]
MKKTTLLRVVPAAVAGAVALYAGIGFLALPAIVKSQAVQFTAEKLHRQLSIDEVTFNPFTLAMQIRGFKLLEPQGGAVFASFDALSLDLAGESLWRLAPVVEQLRLTQPYVHLVRKDANHYSIDDILELAASQPPSPEPARFAVHNIELEGGRIAFEDMPARATHTVEGLKLGVPFVSSMPSDVQVFVEPLLSAKINGAPLLVKGKARPFSEAKEFAVDLNLDGVELPRYLDYLPGTPNFKLPSASLSTRLTASFVQPKGKAAALVVRGEASLKNLAMTQADGKPLLKLAALDAKLASLDIFAGRYELARLAFDGLDVDVARDAKGRLNFDRLMQPAAAPAEVPAAASSKAPAVASAAAPAAKPAPQGTGTQVSLKELVFSNASLRYADDTPQSAAKAGVEKFALTVRDIVADTGKKTVAIGDVASSSANVAYTQGKRAAASAAVAPAAKAAEDAPYLVTVANVDIKDWSLRVEDRSHADPVIFALSPASLAVQDISTAPASHSKFDLKAAVNKTGQLGISGTLGLAPFNADLALDLKNIGLLPVQPYATDYVNLRFTQAAVSTKGKLLLETGKDGALLGGFKGNASVNNLATVDKTSSNDFLSWKALSFDGMDVKLQPFALSVDKVALSDFFARVIIDPTGRLNVQDIKRNAANEDRSLTEAGSRATAAIAQAKAAKADKAAASSTPSASVPAPAGDAAPMPPIRIGQLTLSGGRVRFTDNFIKPNYTANLKGIGGTVAGLSSDPNSNASVSLRGEVNSAPLLIAGRVNPLKRDLSLDLKAEVRGMELASLSTYADKYVGYGIEKGKLTFEVAYQLENRALKAENRLVLDQLTFGNESTNPEATKLPVRLAVALLSDRNGVIDINVPIGGSLDDPEFSLGGIILKIIGNAIVKTVTAPFALIGSLFGGGEELSKLDFEAGHANLLPASETRLQALAKALTERPGLKLDITGRADPAADLEALKRVAIERKVRQLKTRDLQARNAVPEGTVVVGKDEYPALLARVYKDETFAKPKNALGLQKTLPPDEMEKLMLANSTVTEADVLALGARRAQAAKEWLSTTGAVSAERIFIVTAKTSPAFCGVDFALK